MSGRPLVVIQARMSSTRLPAKAMLSVGGQAMVVLAARRAGRTGFSVVVATSDRAEDDVTAATVSLAGIRVVRGALDDPLGRFVQAADGCDQDDIIVRLTGDNLVPDADLVERLVGSILEGHEFARIGGDDRALPYGVAGEAFTCAALRSAHVHAITPHEREHVTPWLRQNYGDHRMTIEDADPAWAGLRCTVDTFDDYVRIARLFGSVDDPVAVGWWELCDLLARHAPPSPAAWAPRPSGTVAHSPIILGTVQLGLTYGAANRERHARRGGGSRRAPGRGRRGH